MRPPSIVAATGSLAVVLAGGAALEGQSLAASAHADEARPWLVASALLGAAGVWLLDRALPDDPRQQPTHELPEDRRAGRAREVPDEPRPLPRRRRLGSLGLLGVAGCYSLIATALVVLRTSLATATHLWLLGLIAALAGAVLSERRSPRLPWPRGRAQLGELGLLLAVIGLAFWLRLPDLAAIPPNVHGDEASIGVDARLILSGDLPAVFATGWYNVPALSFALHAATMRVFGDDLFGLRMASAIEGLMSVVLLYALTRRLWGPRPALLAAALMAIAAWHIHFSRTGFHYMQAPAATLVVLYFLVRGVQDGHLIDWVACGLAVGVCVEVYYAARLGPVVAAVFLGYCVLTERDFLKTHARGLLALIFSAVVFLAPMAAVFVRDPDNFGSRTAGVLITTPENLRHELDGYHVGTLAEVIAVQAGRTLEAFNIRGETSLQYGHPGPLFDFWTDALLAMSAVAILLRLRSARDVLLGCWVWLGLFLGSVMTIDAVFAPHLVVVIPALLLAPALFIDRLWRHATALFGRLGTYVFALPVIVVLGLALQSNVHDYFDVQIVERQPAGRFTLLSNYAASINARYQLYVIGRADWTLRFSTAAFLVPNADAVDVRNAPLTLPLERIPAAKGVAFLVENGADDYTQRMVAIRETYPTGQEVVISERAGRPTFTSYLVENATLASAGSAPSREPEFGPTVQYHQPESGRTPFKQTG